MEHKLSKVIPAAIYCTIFICMAAQLIHNIFLKASAEGIILIGGLTCLSAELAWGGIREVIEEEN